MNIAVLAGGRTPERDISLRSGHRVAGALTALGHAVGVLDPAELPLAQTLQERKPDICWLALHGKAGEDGTVQRLLELLDIAYTGTRPFDCEIAFDKVLAKDALHRAGIPTPEWVAIEGSALRDLGAGVALAGAAERVGLPCVVKPSRSGSALGVGFVEREADLPAAVMAALSFSGAAIVERRVEGVEVAVGMIGTPFDALPPIEIVPKDGWYDYAARYTAGATEYFAPARLGAEQTAEATAVSARAADALGLLDLTRVDLIVDGHGKPWVLEVNVSPGMTDTSLLPMSAQAAGMSLEHLCDAVLRSATARVRRPA